MADRTAVRTVHTSCRICLQLCGIDVEVDDEDRIVSIRPDKQNPYTWRDFCAKARTAREFVEHPRRLRTPMRRTETGYVEATWDEAIADISARLRAIIDVHGPDSVGLYWGNPAAMQSAHVMFASGFMDAVGSRQRYGPTSVDSNNMHLVNEELYGSPVFCLVPDVDECRCFLLVGMNPAESAMNWIEVVPDGWRRILDAQAAGADVIVVDPRRTATAEKATTHVPVRPGQDWALLLGILKVVLDKGWEHREDCEHLLSGFGEVRSLVAEADLDELSGRCGVPADQIADIARRFASAPTAMCVTHTGVSQHTTGTLGEWLGHVLNLVTGRIDRPGGRRVERGYVDSTEVWSRFAPRDARRSRVRGLPSIVGLFAVAELADEITTPGRGQIRAMFVSGGNPVVTGPDGAKLDAALATLDLLVAVDLLQRDSHRQAHWLIPDTHFLEREDLFALSSQFCDRPYAQYAQRAVPPPAGVRESWSFYTDLALAMGVPLFGKRGVNTFVKATRLAARLAGREALAFNPRWVNRLLVASGRRIKWKDLLAHPHGWVYGEKEFGGFRAALRTPDQRVQVAPAAFVAEARRQLAAAPASPSGEYPLLMTSHRRRNFMNSQTGQAESLHRREPTNDVELNPADADAIGVRTGDVVRVVSSCGAIELPATVTDAVQPGVVVVRHGWGARVFDTDGEDQPLSYGMNRNLLVSDRDLDPLSQIPALNSQPVRVEKLA